MSVRTAVISITTVLCFFAPSTVAGASFELVSVVSNRAVVRYTLSQKEVLNVATLSPLLFAFSSSKTLSPSVTVRSEAMSGDATRSRPAALPTSILAKGFAASSYFQWIAFSPFTSGSDGVRKPVTKGLITIDFGSPAIRTTDKAWIRSGMLHFGLTSGLLKATLAQKPNMPFTTGLKLFIDKDGIYQLVASDLRKNGVPIDRIQSRYLKIFNGAEEVPLYVSNSQHNMLGDDDDILFYATALHGTTTYFSQFSNSNVYWLTWQTDRPGIRIAEVSGAIRKDLSVFRGSATSSIAAREFLDTIHLEQDNEILSLGDINVGQEMSDSTSSATDDIWYWGRIGKSALTTFTINLPPASRSSDVSKTARVHIKLQGATSDPTVNPDHKLAIYLNSDTLGFAQWDGQTSYDFISAPFPSSRLQAGANTVTFAVQSTLLPGTDQSELNWIEIEYYRSFVALDNTIQFKNNFLDTAGIYQFSITGFTQQSVDLWDISQHRLYTGFEIHPDAQKGNNASILVFQDSLTSVRRFFAAASVNRLQPTEMALDTIRSDWSDVASADYVIIAPDSFRLDLAPLVDVYKSKKMTVAVVDISDVYNAFSNGIRDPESIRTMLRYVLSLPSAKPPRYLLLGGDTTHDLDKNNRSRNLVPTHLSMVPGWGPASNDGYFATVVGDDNFPDLFVGRFPAENRVEMKNLVNKTVKYLTLQVKGPWHDNLLMLGGAERDFTDFNDHSISEVIGPSLNVTRLDGDPTSRYYHDASVASKDIAGYINAGLYAINFNGHGGGLVWSDSRFFSYMDLDKLYNGQWDKAGRLPLVFSFTCLTGFFESPDYRSLGEEFVRQPQNGAIGFFGASAYTSKNGNLAMDRLFLDDALNGSFESVGELLWLVKVQMLARFGSEYLPLIQQYNFLGDPALPWILPADTLKLSLAQQTLGSRDSLAIGGSCSPVASGQAKITLGADCQKWSDYLWNVSSTSFSGHCFVKDSLRTSHGYVHAFAWNDSSEIRGWTSFSKNALFFKSVSIEPSAPHFGDSVQVKAIIEAPDTQRQQVTSVFCLYTVASRSAISPVYQGVSLFKDTSGTWETAGKIPIAFHGSVGDELLLRFREVGTGVSDTSDSYAFQILGRPDLLFTGSGPQLVFYNDSLFIGFEVLNAGTTASPPFSVVCYKDSLASSNALLTFSSRDSLFPGKSKRFLSALADTQGIISVFCVINPSAAFDEINRDNNTAQISCTVFYRDMQDVSDSLFSLKKGVCIAPYSRFNVKHRVFLFSDSISSSQPLKTESRWTPVKGDSIAKFWIGVRPVFSPSDSLSWVFWRLPADSSSLSKKAALSIQARLCVCRFDPDLGLYRYATSSADSAKMTCVMHSRFNGPFSLSQLSDNQPPQIRASVDGREVLFLDYAAKDRPFNLFLSDASGIAPSSVAVVLNRHSLDSSLITRVAPQSDLKEFSLTVYPQKEYSIDSMSVSAQDLAGNVTTKVFAYMPGEDLSIKFFSCHPNPFTAKQDANGGTIQTIRFAFLLTDVAKDAKIVVYTIANRVVWTWEKTDGIIGYQEVPWDGKTSQGFRIANGTYYAKLSVKNDSKKATSIIRIAKLEGY